MHTPKDILKIFQESYVNLADAYEIAESTGKVTLWQANELTQAREDYQRISKNLSKDIPLE